MKKYPLYILLLLPIISTAQDSFQGKIEFINELEINQKVPDGYEKGLREKYGDHSEMIYSKKGYFKRRYINSGISGNDYQIYLPENGTLLVAKKNPVKIDTGSVVINSLKFISFKQIKSEKIMNLDCDCYEYVASTKTKGIEVILNYCFSKATTELNPILFEKHEDFFLNDFFKKSERPYLKFSMKIQAFKITYTAIHISEIEIDNSEFK